MNPLALFLAWRTRKRAARSLQIAERKRQAVIDQIADRRKRHVEFKPLFRDLRQATNDSLRAALLSNLKGA